MPLGDGVQIRGTEIRTPIYSGDPATDAEMARQRQEAENEAAQARASEPSTSEPETTTSTARPTSDPVARKTDLEDALKTVKAYGDAPNLQADIEQKLDAIRTLERARKDGTSDDQLERDTARFVSPLTLFGKTNLTTAVKAGMSDRDLEGMGISKKSIGEAKDRVKAEKELKPYDGDMTKAVKDGKADAVEKVYGRDTVKAIRQHIRDEAKQAESGVLAPEHGESSEKQGQRAFTSLVAEGKIPAGSRYEGMDEQGNIRYIPPFAGLEADKAEFEKQPAGVQKRIMVQTFGAGLQGVFVSDATTRSDKTMMIARDKGAMPFDRLSLGEQERVVAEWRRDKAVSQMYADFGAGMVPVVGTIYTWKRTSTPWRAVGIASDVLFVASFIPVGKLVGVARGPASQIDDAIKAGRATERATIKATSPKAVVKAYDQYVKATDEFAKNRVFIRQSERNLAKGIREEAITYGPRLRTLEEARQVDPELAMKAKQAGDAFAKAQEVAAAKRMGSVGKAAAEDATLADFGNRSVSNTRQVIDMAFNGKIPKPAAIERQLKGIQTQLKIAEYDRDIERTKELINRSIELQQKLKIAKSGEMRRLHEEYADIVQKIESKAYSPKQTRKLKVEKLRLENQLRQEFSKGGFKDMEAIWQQPWSKGGGRGRPLKPMPGGGGGRPEPPPYKMAEGRKGARVVYRDTEGNEIWEVPGIERINVGDDVQTMTWPKGAVEAPPKPGTKPPVRPMPEPKPPVRPIPPKPEPPKPERRPTRVPPKPKPKKVPEKPPKREPTREPVIVPRPVVPPEPEKKPTPVKQPEPEKKPDTKPKTTPTPTTKPAPETKPTPGTKPDEKTRTKTRERTRTDTRTRERTSPATQTQARTDTETQTKVKTETPTRTKPDTLHVPTTSVPVTVTTETTAKTRSPEGKKPTKPPHFGGSQSEWTKEQLDSAVAFKMGFGIWGVKEPYGNNDWKFFKPEDAPAGLHISSQHKAMRTIQLYKGKDAPDYTGRNLGIVRAHIRSPGRKPGKAGALSFTPRTRYPSKKKGKLYETRIGSGRLLSRRPLR